MLIQWQEPLIKTTRPGLQMVRGVASYLIIL